MNRKYILLDAENPVYNIQNLQWDPTCDTVTLSWDWPLDRTIKFALIFEHQEDTANVENFILMKRPHDVVMRDLAASYTAIITKEKSKFLLCPAFFQEDHSIVACPPAITTDWIYKKTTINAGVEYKPLHLSRYQEASIKLTLANFEKEDLVVNAITYCIEENNKIIATYPIDRAFLRGNVSLYITKHQAISFMIDPNAEHLIDLKWQK